MSISLFFGLPGCGKTTLMSYHAKRGLSKHSPYKNVYSNVEMNLDGLKRISVDDLGKFNIHDGLVLIDEATIGIGGSKTNNKISNDILYWFLIHRHYNVDVCLYTQRWDGIDKTIRTITDRVYFVYKPFLTGFWFTKYYRIPYDIIIPDPKNGNGEKLGEIVQGYCKPGIMQRIFCGRVFRPLYYKLFNSWEAPELPELPDGREYRKVLHPAREVIVKKKGESRKKA